MQRKKRTKVSRLRVTGRQNPPQKSMRQNKNAIQLERSKNFSDSKKRIGGSMVACKLKTRKWLTINDLSTLARSKKTKWSNEFTVDLDIFKIIFRTCPYVKSLHWRISANRGGFHFKWNCNRNRRCRRCEVLRSMFDDPIRNSLDRRRPIHHRNVLWDQKGKRKSGPWHTIKK